MRYEHVDDVSLHTYIHRYIHTYIHRYSEFAMLSCIWGSLRLALNYTLRRIILFSVVFSLAKAPISALQ